MMLKLKQQFPKAGRQSRSRPLRSLLPLILLASGMSITANPVHANCAGGRPFEVVNHEVQQRANQLKNDSSEFFGQKPLDDITDRRITLTPVFDRFTGLEKQQVLNTLQLSGSSYEVYAADGRLVSAQYDACTRIHLLTERDRYGWYLNRPPVPMPLPMLRDALRNPGQPLWRKVNHSIHPEAERRVRFKFWQTVGYDKEKQGWWIAWVPEGGYFEITVGNADHGVKLQSFLATASQQYRYVVLTRDGTPLSDSRYTRGNPWSWLLSKVSAPPTWQVSACEGEAPFLCVSRDGKLIGSVELQRWDFADQPQLQKQFSTLGLTPGLITYSNPNDRAKVLTALRAVIADHAQTIAMDRRNLYGSQMRFQPAALEPVNVGSLPGFRYGFRSVSQTGAIREQSLSYMAFDGSKYLYIITTSFMPGSPIGTFRDRAHLETFQTHLSAMVNALKLPHPDW